MRKASVIKVKDFVGDENEYVAVNVCEYETKRVGIFGKEVVTKVYKTAKPTLIYIGDKSAMLSSMDIDKQKIYLTKLYAK